MFNFLNKKQPKIYLTNSLTNKEEIFKSIKKNEVLMYHCGPTVYQKAHIGNLRAYVFADLLGRIFKFNKYKVKQVVNITDVGHLVSDNDHGEDKVEKSAKETGKTATEITEKYTEFFMEDIVKLNIRKNEITFPRATKYIKEQIEIIKILESKGVTYKTSDGVYYDTSKFNGYGILGNVKVEQQKAGARVEENQEKINPTDFALWKFSNQKEKRQQEWQSPWGIGFPGWHIECSAMSKELLGEKFDIHTGGVDHIQIHHNNEIAQSQMAFGNIQANYWLHHNHILINNQKMSKSIGNIIYLSDLEERKIDPIVYRYWLLTSHYSTLSNFTWESLGAAENAYKKLLNQFKDVEIGKINQQTLDELTDTLNHDLDTPRTIAGIWKMIKDNKINKGDQLATILEIDNVLGLKIAEKITQNSQKTNLSDIPSDILEKAQKRHDLRKSGDFEGADRLRNEILEAGFEIKDINGNFEIKKQ